MWKGGSQEEKNVFNGVGPHGELIVGPCHLKLKVNQDANSITESVALKVSEENKFWIFIARFAKFQKTERGRIGEAQRNWKCAGILVGNKEVNRADQIDQLNAFRFKMQSPKRNLSREKRGNFGK